MEKRWSVTVICMICVLTFTLAGCDKKQANPPVASPAPIQPGTVNPLSNAGKTDNTDKTKTPAETTTPVSTVSPNTESPEDEPESSHSGEETEPASTKKPEVKPQDKYNVDHPTLMGLPLHSSKSTVLSKFNNPLSQHSLEDEAGTIMVMEYEDFSVGLNAKDLVEFVEVYSDQIDPGLGGLKIGNDVKTAFTILGEPSTNTDYVITYDSQGAVLKLDIDILTNQILSIKLFPSG